MLILRYQEANYEKMYPILFDVYFNICLLVSVIGKRQARADRYAVFMQEYHKNSLLS
jgi:hypothetical protein